MSVCSIRLVNNKTKKRSLTLRYLLYGIVLVVANVVTRSMEALLCIKYILQETVADLRNHLYYLVMKS